MFIADTSHLKGIAISHVVMVFTSAAAVVVAELVVDASPLSPQIMADNRQKNISFALS